MCSKVHGSVSVTPLRVSRYIRSYLRRAKEDNLKSCNIQQEHDNPEKVEKFYILLVHSYMRYGSRRNTQTPSVFLVLNLQKYALIRKIIRFYAFILTLKKNRKYVCICIQSGFNLLIYEMCSRLLVQPVFLAQLER